MDHLNYLNNQPIPKVKIVTTYLQIRWRVLSKMEHLQNEHLIEIKNDKDVQRVYGRVNEIGGSEVYINEKYVHNIISGWDINTIPHELGHSLGLLHPDVNTHLLSVFGFQSSQYWDQTTQLQDTNNLMLSGKNKYMKDHLSSHITPQQVKRAIVNIKIGLINK